MTQPRFYHRIYFALLLSTVSMALPEVITMNDPIPWIHPMGYVLGYPVYGLHILVLGGLMYRYGRIGIVTVLCYGGLFGLYEGYLTKMLWNPTWGTELTAHIGGVRVIHTLLSVFSVHPILAFLIPLVIAELFMTRGARPVSRAFPFLRSRIGVFSSVIVLAVWLGIIMGGHLPKHGGRQAFGAPVVSIAVFGTLSAIWLLIFKGHRFNIRDLMPCGKGLWILAALLLLEYLVYARLLRPEAMPTEWPTHLVTIGIYVFFVTLIMLWRSQNPASDPNEEDLVNASPAPWWLAVLGAGIFLLIAFVHATAKQPGGVVAIISFLGGAVLNLSFLVVCFFVGGQRWLRRRSLPSERCS